MNRRTFLMQAVQGVAAGAAAGGLHRPVRAQESRPAARSNRIRLGLMGVGGMGLHLARCFAELPDAEITWICDIDPAHARAGVAAVTERSGREPSVTPDFRRMLDDTSVHALVIATPDHWHAPATLLACAAGKHVYVEKPCAHNIREGRLMVEAARRYRLVVQVGTQSRSIPQLREAIAKLHEGIIGKVLVAKAWNSQLRVNIGRGAPADPPGGVDYEMWLGPAPYVPYQTNRFHGHWRWWRAFGCGDAGNDGVHDIDIARWGLGVTGHPASVTGVGGKYFFDDDQEFPDTQTVAFEYPAEEGHPQARQLIYEQRIWSPYVQEEHENGNAFYGTDGMMILGKKSGCRVYGPRNKLIAESTWTFEHSPHHRNFIDSIRNAAEPNADVEVGHLSSALSHLANITTHVRRTLSFDGRRERLNGDSEADALVRRSYRKGHWAMPKDV